MKLITSPNYDKFSYGDKSLFLAGGITNCPDWQQIVIELFLKKVNDPKFIMINPRRVGSFDMKNKNESIAQIMWEHEYLKEAKHIMFWFPKETVCPITLFELGKYLQKREAGRHRDGCSSPTNLLLSIGTHPEYVRSLDVKIQTMLVCDLIDVKSNLEDLVEDVIKQMDLKRRNDHDI